MRLRVPEWFLIALAAIIVAGAAAAGAWYASTRDPGPSDAGQAAQGKPEKALATRPELGAAPKECDQRLSELLRELEELQSLIRRGWVSYAQYVEMVMEASSGYGQTSVRDLERECAFSLGVHAQDALDAFVNAGNVWSECTVDVNCDIDSIDTELQAHRHDAAAAIRHADGNGSRR